MAIRRRPRIFLEFTNLQDISAIADHPVFARPNVAIGCYVDWRYAYDNDGYNTFTPSTDPANFGTALGKIYERHKAALQAQGISLGQRFCAILQAIGGCGAYVGSFGRTDGSLYPLMQGLFWHRHDKPFEKYIRNNKFRLRNVGSGTTGTFNLKIKVGATVYSANGISATVTRSVLKTALDTALTGSSRVSNVVDANDGGSSGQLDAGEFYIGFYSGSAEDKDVLFWVDSHSGIASGTYITADERPHGAHWLDYAFPYPYPRAGAGVRHMQPQVEAFLDSWESYRAANSLPHCPLIQVVSESIIPELFNAAYNYEGDNNSEGWWIDFQRMLDYSSMDPELQIGGKSIKQFFEDARLLDGSTAVPAYVRDSGQVGTFQIYRQPINAYAMQLVSSICRIAWSNARYRALKKPILDRYVGMRTGEYSFFTSGANGGNFRYQPPRTGDANHGLQFMEKGIAHGIDLQCPDCYLGPWEWYDLPSEGAAEGRGTRGQWAAFKGVPDPTTTTGKQELCMSLWKDSMLAIKKAGGGKLLMPYHAGGFPNFYTYDQMIDMWVYGLVTQTPGGAQLLDGVHWFAPGNAAAVESSLNNLETVLAGIEDEVTLRGDGGWDVDNRTASP